MFLFDVLLGLLGGASIVGFPITIALYWKSLGAPFLDLGIRIMFLFVLIGSYVIMVFGIVYWANLVFDLGMNLFGL